MQVDPKEITFKEEGKPVMRIESLLHKEHTKESAEKIAAYIVDDASRFNELVEIFVNGPYRITQRASWPLTLVIEKHPGLLRPHYRVILKALANSAAHPAVKRNVFRLLQFVDIPKRYQGEVAQHCFDCLMDKKQPIAARVFAMSVLDNLSVYHPELKKELKLIIEENIPYASAAFISRARKVLKKHEL